MKTHTPWYIRRHTAIAILTVILLCLPTIAASHMEITHSTDEKADRETPLHRLLIITIDQFVDELQPLIQHKEAVGMSPHLVTLDEIYEEMYWQGRDAPEKIKYYIMNAEHYWGTEYILLVGDYSKIPIRYIENQDIDHGFYEPHFISELYYADLYNEDGSFSTWDNNGNGIYGEWMGDIAEDQDIDLYPDVYVGRLACRNAKEVKTCVQKIITYESDSYGTDWSNRIVVCAGDTYLESDNPEWTGYEGEENAIHVLENMSGFEQIHLFTSDESFTSKWDVIRTLSAGCGFMYFDGHANPLRWGTHRPNDEEFIVGLSVPTMSLLHNFKKLPVVVVGGCHNLQFDVNPLKLLEEKWYYFTWLPECWGWKLTRLPQGGSIATIGCSGLGMTKEDKESHSGAGDFMEPSFFHTYTIDGIDILGKCWGMTISRYLDHYPIDWDTPAAGDYAIDAKSCQQWILLGDPSLKIGGYPPDTFE